MSNYEFIDKLALYMKEEYGITFRYGNRSVLEIDENGKESITYKEWFDGGVPGHSFIWNVISTKSFEEEVYDCANWIIERIHGKG